jgi:hypothetical protein
VSDSDFDIGLGASGGIFAQERPLTSERKIGPRGSINLAAVEFAKIRALMNCSGQKICRLLHGRP